MPIITHLVKHIFAYPVLFKVWTPLAERLSIRRFIAYSHNSQQSRHK